MRAWWIKDQNVVAIRVSDNSRPIAIHDQTGIVYKLDLEKAKDILYCISGDFSDCHYLMIERNDNKQILAQSSTSKEIHSDILRMIGLGSNKLNYSIEDVERVYVNTTSTILQQFDAIFSIL